MDLGWGAAMIRLYGTALSRASRSLLALEELSLAYEHVPLVPRPGTEDREILMRLNPNGHIPVLDDGGLIVWESMAINLYLAGKHGGPLWPVGAANRAAILQWSLWAQTEMDRRDWDQARRSGDAGRIASARGERVATLRVLDAALADRPYLLGEAFTLADLNVASTLSQPNEGGLIDWERLDPADHGLAALAGWLARCVTRPSWTRVRALP